ncbi:MAG: hypothetical protein R3B13_39875 [Polyangiaceae bacterium]
MRGFCWLPLCLCVGCETILGADFDDVAARRPAQDAGADTAPDASSCELKHPPGPPDVTGSGGDTRFTVVLHDFYFGERETGGQPDYFDVGYDIDNVCANRGDAPLCTSGYPTADPTDGLAGEDNGVGRMLHGIEAEFGSALISSSAISKGVLDGTFAPLALIEVDGYGGFSDDESLQITWSVALATNAAPSGGFMPKLDGADKWPLADKVQDGTGSGVPITYESSSAYATKRRLVAYFDETLVPLANVYLRAKNVVVSADLDYDPAKQVWTLGEGLIAGFAESSELLNVIPRITAQFLGVPLCTDNPTYDNTKKFICSHADHASPDHVAGEPCDGFSFGIRFSSAPAQAGDPGQFPTPKASCPAGTDPAKDTCT